MLNSTTTSIIYITPNFLLYYYVFFFPANRYIWDHTLTYYFIVCINRFSVSGAHFRDCFGSTASARHLLVCVCVCVCAGYLKICDLSGIPVGREVWCGATRSAGGARKGRQRGAVRTPPPSHTPPSPPPTRTRVYKGQRKVKRTTTAAVI